MNNYGSIFIEKINEFIALNKAEAKKALPDWAGNFISLIRSGNSFKQAAGFIGKTPGSVAMELQKLIEDGCEIDKYLFFSSRDYYMVQAFISKSPGAPLREVREKTALSLDYPVLRIAVSFARKELLKK